MESQILLLRVFELDRALKIEKGTRTDSVVYDEDLHILNLKKPIIPYDKDDRFFRDFQGEFNFKDIIHLIRETMHNMGALRNEKVVNDTSQIEIPA